MPGTSKTWLASPELPMEVFPVPQKFFSSGLNIEDIDHPHPPIFIPE